MEAIMTFLPVVVGSGGWHTNLPVVLGSGGWHDLSTPHPRHPALALGTWSVEVASSADSLQKTNKEVNKLHNFKDNSTMVTDELFLKFGKFVILRYDKISSQNMHRKRERIKQNCKVKNLPKLLGARNPPNCLCSFEQQESSVVFLFQVR